MYTDWERRIRAVFADDTKLSKKFQRNEKTSWKNK